MTNGWRRIRETVVAAKPVSLRKNKSMKAYVISLRDDGEKIHAT
jgi:hypothetical protein